MPLKLIFITQIKERKKVTYDDHGTGIITVFNAVNVGRQTSLDLFGDSPVGKGAQPPRHLDTLTIRWCIVEDTAAVMQRYIFTINLISY